MKTLLKTIRIYDNNGKTADRFTAVFMDHLEKKPKTFFALAMNSQPFHPLGIGMSCTATPGRHLGKRIPFESLPVDCQNFILQVLKS
mgnify:CR=1 FL=1